jgi:hypothetical protein
MPDIHKKKKEGNRHTPQRNKFVNQKLPSPFDEERHQQLSSIFETRANQSLKFFRPYPPTKLSNRSRVTGSTSTISPSAV